MKFFERYSKALEFDKVLERLAEFTGCEDARNAALHLTPETDINLAGALLSATTDAHTLLARFGGPSFGGLKNVNNSLARAAAGSVLNTRELLDIGEVLRVIRSLSQWRESNSGEAVSLDPLFNALMPNKFLESAIFDAIIAEDEISDKASPELSDIEEKSGYRNQMCARSLINSRAHPQTPNIFRKTLSLSETADMLCPSRASTELMCPALFMTLRQAELRYLSSRWR